MFTSGGRTGILISRQALTYFTTSSDLPEAAGQRRRHEVHRVVGLHPRGLVGEEGVDDGVRLVEPVAAERVDQLPELLRLLLRRRRSPPTS